MKKTSRLYKLSHFSIKTNTARKWNCVICRGGPRVLQLLKPVTGMDPPIDLLLGPYPSGGTRHSQPGLSHHFYLSFLVSFQFLPNSLLALQPPDYIPWRFPNKALSWVELSLFARLSVDLKSLRNSIHSKSSLSEELVWKMSILKTWWVSRFWKF